MKSVSDRSGDGRGGPGDAWITASETETEAVGELLAGRLPEHATVLLEGDLGSGKTVLVRGLARALAIDDAEVQSPSYTLIHEHQGRAGGGQGSRHGGRLVHVDLYRLDPEDLPALGLDELLAGPGLKAVEWGGRLGPSAGDEPVRLCLTTLPDGRRRIEWASRRSEEGADSPS